MKAQGVQLVISPTYWSFPKKAMRSDALLDDEVLLIDSLCTTRAFENNILFVYCNAANELEQPDGSVAVLSGRSQVTHPLEKVLVQCEGNAEEMLVCAAHLAPLVPVVSTGESGISVPGEELGDIVDRSVHVLRVRAIIEAA